MLEKEEVNNEEDEYKCEKFIKQRDDGKLEEELL